MGIHVHTKEEEISENRNTIEERFSDLAFRLLAQRTPCRSNILIHANRGEFEEIPNERVQRDDLIAIKSVFAGLGGRGGKGALFREPAFPRAMFAFPGKISVCFRLLIRAGVGVSSQKFSIKFVEFIFVYGIFNVCFCCEMCLLTSFCVRGNFCDACFYCHYDK